MVQNQQDQNSGTNWQEEARRQANMYPNLEEFLNRMMPENQSEFLREFFNAPNTGSSTSNASSPTAPPAHENSEENGANNSGSGGGWNWQNWSDNWQNYHAQQQQRQHQQQQQRQQQQQQQQQQQRPNNSQNNERTDQLFHEDDVSILLQRIGQKFAENFARAIGFVAFMLPILIVPKYFLALGIFAAFMKSFGVSLTPLVLGGIFYEIITALDPILITLLGIWTIWKVLILRKPLVDVNYWKLRINARCHSRRSNY